MVNWNKLAKSIPSQVQIGPKTVFKVLWAESFPDDCLGETHHSLKQIHIKLGQSPKETVLTYLHEVLHSFSDTHDIGLTEKQVSMLEKKVLYYWIKSGNLFIS